MTGVAWADNWNPDALRTRINQYGPYVGAGVEVTHIAADASEVRVRMRLDDSNRNLVGTHFGGSLYAMVDPHLMILLMRQLGPEYTVWDRSATIDFVAPGRGLVSAVVRLPASEVEPVREATRDGAPAYPEWSIDITNEAGDVVATVRKTLYVRRKDAA